MKNKIIILLFIFILVLGFYSCQKPEPPTEVTVKTVPILLSCINASPSGLKMQAQEDDITVSEESEGRYRITLKNLLLNFDLSVFKDLNSSLDGKKIPMTAGEMVLLYQPGDKYLQLLSIANFKIDYDFADLYGKAGPGREVGIKMNLSIKNTEYKKLNISSLISGKAKNFREFITLYGGDNINDESKIEEVQMDFLVSIRKGLNFSFVLSLDELSGSSTGSPEFYAAYYHFGADKTKLEDFLARGQHAADIKLKAKNFEYFLLKNGVKLSSGRIAEAASSMTFRPDEEKKFYVFESSADLKDFAFSIPRVPMLDVIAKAKEMSVGFAARNISPGLIKAYTEMSNSRWEPGSGSLKKRSPKVEMLRMAVISEFFKAQPVLNLDISSFKHPLGEVEAAGELSFAAVGVPVGKVEVTFKNMKEILERIREELPLEVEGKIIRYLQEEVVVNESGDGILSFEKKLGPSR